MLSMQLIVSVEVVEENSQEGLATKTLELSRAQILGLQYIKKSESGITTMPSPALYLPETDADAQRIFGKDVSKFFTRVIFAPDHEFERTLFPLDFWLDHLQSIPSHAKLNQMLRWPLGWALGIGFIWVAMLLSPMILGWLMVHGYYLTAFLYLLLGVVKMKTIAQQRAYSPFTLREVIFYLLVYPANYFAHMFFNLLAPVVLFNKPLFNMKIDKLPAPKLKTAALLFPSQEDYRVVLNRIPLSRSRREQAKLESVVGRIEFMDDKIQFATG